MSHLSKCVRLSFVSIEHNYLIWSHKNLVVLKQKNLTYNKRTHKSIMGPSLDKPVSSFLCHSQPRDVNYFKSLVVESAAPVVASPLFCCRGEAGVSAVSLVQPGSCSASGV